MEVCYMGVTACFCTDLRKPEAEQNYQRPFGKTWQDGGCIGMKMTNPVDDTNLKNEWILNCYGQPNKK